ncbi:MAG: T9SS type A sorting domain-containing protein [Lewinellaceae bacterium]|nr:T9SS type A sorting domain-containing protein [Lewinellaceae bacterium]
MKHYILPVLFWTLAASQIFAQKTLAPSAQSHFMTLPKSVQKVMHNAGFKTESAIVSNTAESRSNALQLDSTKTFIGYNINGGQDSIPQFRAIYQYPQPAVEVEIEAEFVGGVWNTVARTTETSDALDRVTNSLTEVYEPDLEIWLPETKVEIFPRGNSMELLDSFKIYEWHADLNLWVLLFQSKYTFNAQGQLVKTETTIDFNGEPTLFSDHYYYLNDNNHLIESFLVVNGFSIPTTISEMAYSTDLLVQTILSNFNGAGFTPGTRTTLAYNSDKLVKRMNLYDYVPGVNDWKPTQSVDYTYDNSLRLSTLETEFILIGQPSEKQRVTYAYVEDEHLALESNYVLNIAQNQFELVERQYYYYSDGTSAVLPTPGVVKALVLSPNPSMGEVRFQMDEEAEVRVYDAAGQILQSRIIQPGEALNLYSLPAGIYHLTVRSKEEFFVGKLAKQ